MWVPISKCVGNLDTPPLLLQNLMDWDMQQPIFLLPLITHFLMLFQDLDSELIENGALHVG